MGRPFILTNENHALPGVRRKTVGRALYFGPTTLRLMLITAAALLAVFYVAAASSAGTRYLDLSRLEEERKALEEERQQLELLETRQRSLPAIEQVAPSLKLEPITKAEYLAPSSGVAKRTQPGG